TAMRGATAPRLQLELICARVLLPGAYGDERAVQARLDRLERGMAAGALSAGHGPAAPPTATSPDAQAAPAAPEGPGASAGPEDGAAARSPRPSRAPSPDAPPPASAAPSPSTAPVAEGQG